jgi:hypothetical protein
VAPNKAANHFISYRTILCIILGSCLLFAGIYSDQIFKILTELYQSIFLSIGLTALAAKPQAGISDLITMRSLPAIATYSLGYVTISFLFLHFYLADSRKSKLSLYFYAGIFLICLFLIALGKVFPAFQEAYKLARHLIEFIISPFPVILLVATFKAFPSSN